MQSTISPSNCQQTSWLFFSISDKMEAPGCNKRNTLDHPLTEMMFLVISGVLSGFNPWTDIRLLGEEKLDWLPSYFPYENGIPWHGTSGRVFARLDNEQLGQYFIALHKITEGQVVAIDGKRMRGDAVACLSDFCF